MDYLPNPNPYALRNRQDFYSRNPTTFRYETEAVPMAPNIWSKVPAIFKISLSLETRMCL